VRAKPRQSEDVGIRFTVDQQQVGLDMAFAVARPIAAQIVVAIASIQRVIGRQRYENGLQRIIECCPVLVPLDSRL